MVCHLQERVMTGEKSIIFSYCPSLMRRLPQFLPCNWYQGELSVIFSKAPGVQPLSQVCPNPGVPRRFTWVSAGVGACENNLPSAFWFQINALWSDYRKFLFFFYFSHSSIWKAPYWSVAGGATEQPWFCSMGGTFCSAHSDMGELTPWDMLLGCSFL